ncbi:MAG: hypothetical protein Q4D98_06420 [Planctomycetia bacterium]|nr:hypothetical protein [Planctomycetia bacterium]
MKILKSLILLAFLVNFGFAEEAKKRIRLEIFCDGPLDPMAAQEWGAALQSCGFQSVQLRGGDASDVLDIQATVPGEYKVTGMLTRKNMLLLPGQASFSRGRIREIQPYLEEKIDALAQAAPPESPKPERSKPAPDVFFAELSEPVGFATQGKARKLVLRDIVRLLPGKVRVPDTIRDVLDSEDKVTEELESVSRGTALAYVLRYVGYCLVPETSPSGPTLRMVPAEKAGNAKILPIGWETSDEVESFHEKFNANVNGAKVYTVLEALSKRLEVPFLYDYNALARHGIELTEVAVKQRPAKVSYRELLDLIAFQVSLRWELRVDDAGRPFVWFTTKKAI